MTSSSKISRVAWLALFWSASASAKVYPVPVQIDTEEDLLQLYTDGFIEQDDYDALAELFHNPLDINSASRGDLYDLPGLSMAQVRTIIKDRRENGRFNSVGRLARVDGVDARLVAQLRPFVQVQPPAGKGAGVTGYVRVKTVLELDPKVVAPADDYAYRTHSVEQFGYDELPNSYLKARFKYRRQLEAGFLGLAQDRARTAAYNPDSGDFSVGWGTPAFELGKVYLSAEHAHATGIVGSYTVGFGTGLVFDRTSRSHPHGWYNDLSVTGKERFRLTKGLFGGAVRLAEWRPGNFAFDATGFASSRRHDLYQYYMGLTKGEDVDPLVDELDSPRVFVDGQKVGWVTLPNAYREDLVGGNVTVGYQRSTRVGFTSYVGRLDTSVIEGVPDDQQWVIRRGYPMDPTYGAAGVNLLQYIGDHELRAEIAKSFTGGSAALVEGVVDLGRTQVEGTLRNYDTDYDNPHASGTAAPDQYGGMQDRDERGARLKVETVPIEWLKVRVFGDVWENISTGRSNLELYSRVQLDAAQDLTLVAYGDHRNRDLANNGRTRIYGGDYFSFEDSTGTLATESTVLDSTGTGDVFEGAGAKSYLAGQVRYDGIEGVSLQVFYKRYWEDAGLLYPTGAAVCEPWYQIGQYTWFKARYKPTDKSTVTARVRYRDDDIWGSADEHSLETWLQLQQKLPHRMKVSLRGTVEWMLADPAASWKGACDRSGVPELDGTCVATTQDVVEASTTGKPTGLLQATVEGRF